MDLQPAFIPAREALATAYRSSGRHVDATEQLEALAALDRGRPARLIALGLEYADARRTDLAVATLSRAAERFPDNVDVYATLGEVWLRIAVDTGDGVALRKALEALRTAVVRGGSSRELALYGRALLAAGDTAAALRSLREAATKLPVAPATLLDLATAAERLGDRQTARDALQRHVALLAGSTPPASVVRHLGDLSLALGDTPRPCTGGAGPRRARATSRCWCSWREPSRASATTTQPAGRSPAPSRWRQPMPPRCGCRDCWREELAQVSTARVDKLRSKLRRCRLRDAFKRSLEFRYS